MTSAKITTDVTIVGAGPYGLSIAAHLKAAKVPYKIFGKPLESWNTYMPDGLFLKSEPFASNLWDPQKRYTFERFCQQHNIHYQETADPVSLTRFLDYAEWFRQNAVGEVDEIKVTNIRQGNGFLLELADGRRVESRKVILATGHMPFCSVPSELSKLPADYFKHTAQIKDVTRYKGLDVAVIGAGQSALETAALIQEAGGKVSLLVRKNQITWNPPSNGIERSIIERIQKPEAGLGSGWAVLAISELPRAYRFLFEAEKRHRHVATSWGPSGSAWLRKRIENHMEILTGHSVRGSKVVGDRVQLSVEGPNGIKELLMDQVVAGTGFKLNLERLDYLDDDLRQSIVMEGVAPALSSNFETSVSGLYIVGLLSAPTFGPVMRFMFGSKHAAPIITRRLKALAKNK